jgi:hypothetical protein
MTMPGFTAEAALDRGREHYRMRLTAPGGGTGVSPAQFVPDTGISTGIDLGDTGIGTDISTCKQTTVCGPCIRFCIPRFGCFGFRECQCTTKSGGTRFFGQTC